jgi:VWFA-related protein
VEAPTSQTDPEQFRLVSSVNLVLLDVSVMDSRGGFVAGLTKQDFQVLDSGARQEIAVFSSEDLPVTVGIVVDRSRSMLAKNAEVMTAAMELIHESNPQDEMFVVSFHDSVEFGLPAGMTFSDDRNVLRNALFKGEMQGRTALFDAVAEGLAHLERGKQGRKALVILSDGKDNASSRTKQQILHLAQVSRATVYAVGIYDAEGKDRDPGFLKQLAEPTGGEAFFPQEPNMLARVCRQIAKDIRSRYTLGFRAPESGAGQPHRLEVKVTAKNGTKLAVRSRKSYVMPSAGGRSDLP